ncbi:hypothetical protein AWE51_10075 [Aquimarina aggregata]|uniref:Uncharacterized protein n=1 Tax=Aquimarina aggregata TaxID=1642818 RepID=A0A162ZRF1_9FLAO|nr:hypothetical protein [Aquimarina aggregata]KZS39978.1 hypothetical protein AWE51_10075 [Aquimarina aggregata]
MSKKHSTHTKSTKRKYNTQKTEGNKIVVLILTFGAIVAAIAPFLHIFCSRESKVEMFGFRNARMFFYAIGVPVTLFISSIILSYVSNFIGIKTVYHTVRNIAFIFLSVASYYLIWIFWAKGDFNPIAYYSMIIIIACSFGYFSNKFLKYISTSTNRLSKISNNIPNLDDRIKTVNDIAKIMPDDNEDMVTYKAMVDVTGDNLKETITEIKKDLN